MVFNVQFRFCQGHRHHHHHDHHHHHHHHHQHRHSSLFTVYVSTKKGAKASEVQVFKSVSSMSLRTRNASTSARLCLGSHWWQQETKKHACREINIIVVISRELFVNICVHYVYIYIYIHIWLYMYAQYMYIYIYVYIYTYVYIYMYIYIYVYAWIHINITQMSVHTCFRTCGILYHLFIFPCRHKYLRDIHTNNEYYTS